MGMAEWHSCGRPTKVGTSCGQRRYGTAPACNRHLTAGEKAERQQREQTFLSVLSDRQSRQRPACWTWPVTSADRERPDIYFWQAGRCAMCGRAHQVLDHDHDTGWIRGYLCRGCNISEGSSASRVAQRYRKWNPARILDTWERYDNPLSGLDRGRLDGFPTARPLVVDTSGVTHFIAPWISVPTGLMVYQGGPNQDAALSAILAARLAKSIAELGDRDT